MNAGSADFLQWRVHDAWLRFQAAPEHLRLYLAGELVQARFDRGDYAGTLQALDEATRDGLARALVEGRAI